MKKFLSSIFLISYLILPAVSLALELQYPEIDIPGIGKVKPELGMDLNKLVAWFYYFIIAISGISAFIMLVWGGVQWLTSTGNPAKIGEAKDRITSTLLGILIILGSWLILRIINPDLTVLKLPGLSN